MQRTIGVPSAFVSAMRESVFGILSVDADSLEGACVPPARGEGASPEAEIKELRTKIERAISLLDELGWVKRPDEARTEVTADPGFLFYILEETEACEYQPGEAALRGWIDEIKPSLMPVEDAPEFAGVGEARR